MVAHQPLASASLTSNAVTIQLVLSTVWAIGTGGRISTMSQSSYVAQTGLSLFKRRTAKTSYIGLIFLFALSSC